MASKINFSSCGIFRMWRFVTSLQNHDEAFIIYFNSIIVVIKKIDWFFWEKSEKRRNIW